MDGNILIEEPWSSKDNLTYIHDNHITPYLVFIEIKLNQDKTLLFHI